MHSYYLGLGDNTRGEICGEIAKLRPFDSAESFRTEFDRKVSEYKSNREKNMNSGSGGGSGSSGGSGRNTSAVSVPSVVKPQPEEICFTDIDGVSWAKEAIEALTEKNIIAKTEKFRPNDEITRAEFLKLLMGTANIRKAVRGLKDVSETDWYYTYAAAAENAGIITGDKNGVQKSGNGCRMA